MTLLAHRLHCLLKWVTGETQRPQRYLIRCSKTPAHINLQTEGYAKVWTPLRDPLPDRLGY
jgi:hypothetical protein